MNILLWILQILLALWNLIGAFYMVNNYDIIANKWALNTLSNAVWLTIGALQILFALGLILPMLIKSLKKFIPVCAICLAIISLLGIPLYDAYSTFPGMLWAIIPALFALVVAFGRIR